MHPQFIARLEQQYRAGVGTHLFLLFLTVSCLLLGGWAALGHLDIVSQAEGQVVPSSRVRTVQHLEGGIVREILVHEGLVVAAGQPVIILEQVVTDTYFEEVQSRIVSLRLDIARLEALRQGETLTLSGELQASYPDMAYHTEALFTALQNAHQSNLTFQTEQIRQREHHITEITTRRTNARQNLKLLQEQVALSESLLVENLTTRYQHLAYLREESVLKSRIEEDGAALEAARSALKEASAGLEKIRTDFLRDIENQLKRSRQELEEILQRQRRHTDTLERTVIRVPVDGVIKTLHVTTVGGVVRPGMDIAEIVPMDDTLVVEAMLPVSDIGYVREGQPATVRLANRESILFGKLEGTVIHVAPDTTITGTGGAYYAVRVKTADDRFRHRDLEYRLYPGMLMHVSIHIGARSVLQYLLDPLFGTMTGIFQER